MWRPNTDSDASTESDAESNADSDVDGYCHPDPGQAASAAGETGSAEDRRLRR